MDKNISYYKDLIRKHFFTFFIVFSLVFSLVLVYAYFAKKVYLSEATVEIIKYKQDNTSNNPLQITIKESSPEDESEILKSNLLIEKAVKNLDFNIEYYDFFRKKNHAIEKEEFPLIIKSFKVKHPQVYNLPISIIPVDSNSYKVSINTKSFISKLKGSKVINIEKIYNYGELSSNNLFNILIIKKTIKREEQ